MRHIIENRVIGIVLISYCVYQLFAMLRDDYFSASRVYWGHRKIYRTKQPFLYWFNFILGLTLVF